MAGSAALRCVRGGGPFSALTLLIAAAALLIQGCVGQHLVRPPDRAAVLAGSSAVTLHAAGSYCVAVGAVAGDAAVAANLATQLPQSFAVVAVTFTPDQAASSVPSGARCGVTASGVATLVCGGVYAAAWRCDSNMTSGNAAIIAAAAGSSSSSRARLVAVSQDTIVTPAGAAPGTPDAADGSVTLLVGRRMHRESVCSMQLVVPPAVAAAAAATPASAPRICGSLVVHVVPMWSSSNLTHLYPSIQHGVSAFMRRPYLLPGSAFPGWVSGAGLLAFVTDASAAGVCDGVTGNSCTLVFAGSDGASDPVAVDDVSGAAVWLAPAGATAAQCMSHPNVITAAMLNITTSSLLAVAARVVGAANTGPGIFVAQVNVTTSPAIAHLYADGTVDRSAIASTARVICTGVLASTAVQRQVRRYVPCTESTLLTCGASPFCRVRSTPGACCWNGVFVGVGGSATAVGVPSACQSCDNNAVVTTPSRVWDHSCSVRDSVLYMRNLVSLACATSAASQAQCASDAYRCNGVDFDAVVAVNNVFASACATLGDGAQCLDPSFVCHPSNATLTAVAIRTSTPVAASGVVRLLVAATVAGVAVPPFSEPTGTASSSSSLFDIPAESIRQGTVMLTLSISATFVHYYWNATVLPRQLWDGALDSTSTVVSPTQAAFGVDGAVSLLGFFAASTVSADGSQLRLQLGPADVSPLVPQTVTIRGTNVLWAARGLQDAPFADIKFRVVDAPLDTRMQRAAFVLSASATAVGVAGGFTGWVGICALQSTLVLVTSSCTPNRTSAVFDGTAFLVSPASLIFDVDFTIFCTQCGMVAGATILHGLVAVVHYFFVVKISLRNSCRATGFPSFPLYAFVVLLVGSITAAQGPIYRSPQALIRIGTVTIGVTCLAIAALVWIQVLRRGSEKYYAMYDLGFLPAAAKLFFPNGWWPDARRFTPIRSICHDRGSSFTLAVAVCMGLSAAFNAGYLGTNLCAVKYTPMVLSQIALLVLFAYLRPFRIPILNVIWGVTRLAELGLTFAFLAWTVQLRSQNEAADRMAVGAMVIIAMQGLFNLFAFIAITLERIYKINRKLANRAGEEEAQAKQQELDDALDGAAARFDAALAARTRTAQSAVDAVEGDVTGRLPSSPLAVPLRGEQVALALPPIKRWVDTAGHDSPRRAAAVLPPTELGLTEEELDVACSVELTPLPPGFTEGHLMHALQIFEPSDVRIIGASAFVSLPSRASAVTMLAALDGRLLHDTRVQLTLLDLPTHLL